MQLRLPAFLLVASALVACGSSSTGSTTSAATPAPTSDPVADDAGSPAAEDAGPTDTCAPPPSKSGCDKDASWVRGVARFDPSHFKPGAKPVLRAVLRHGFVFYTGEDAIGGRLHAWASIPVDDPSKGEIPFAVDMCGEGAAMWSEENGSFHLVLILDEDGSNDIDNATTNDQAITAGIPGPTELVKMVDVDVSCNAKSACLDVTLDCTGKGCLQIQPITSCAKKKPGCNSDSAFCH